MRNGRRVARIKGVPERKGRLAGRVAASVLSPEKAYEDSMKELERLLAEVEKKMRRHQDAFKKDPVKWSYVGDVALLRNLFGEVAEVLGNLA